jgi:hypothetical protein
MTHPTDSPGSPGSPGSAGSANVKPLTHWAIYKGYKLRFRSRAPTHVTGVITGADGIAVPFAYLPAERLVQLPDQEVRINEFGWEIERRYTQ